MSRFFSALSIDFIVQRILNPIFREISENIDLYIVNKLRRMMPSGYPRTIMVFAGFEKIYAIETASSKAKPGFDV